MITSFMITLREGLEAFLIVGIILAYLARTHREELKKYVYYGTGLAIAASLTAAGIFNLLSIRFAGRNEELFEGVLSSLAKSLFGYNSNPSLLEVLSYVGYYVLTYVFYRNIVKSEYTEIATPFKPVAE
jgi:high-affinity Fe2+/Pb2+ permease